MDSSSAISDVLLVQPLVLLVRKTLRVFLELLRGSSSLESEVLLPADSEADLPGHGLCDCNDVHDDCDQD